MLQKTVPALGILPLFSASLTQEPIIPIKVLEEVVAAILTAIPIVMVHAVQVSLAVVIPIQVPGTAEIIQATAPSTIAIILRQAEAAELSTLRITAEVPAVQTAAAVVQKQPRVDVVINCHPIFNSPNCKP